MATEVYKRALFVAGLSCKKLSSGENMTDAGGINTCFLTSRLPLWAGVRQNVVGSNINGVPVLSGVYNGSSSSTATARAVTAEAEASLAVASEVEGAAVAGPSVMEEIELLKDAIVRAEASIAGLTATMRSLQATMDSIQASIATTGEK